MQYRSAMAKAVASLRPADPVDISDAQYPNLPPGLLIDQENEFAQSVKEFYSRHVGA
ncbi:MAG: hypothetical protein DHS20C11_19810 [Lysobacteraceae bacterium]|nr:MAG: hypothetical protein DHS20C11_19810 [Xanthomonadaceae bacterium]